MNIADLEMLTNPNQIQCMYRVSHETRKFGETSHSKLS